MTTYSVAQDQLRAARTERTERDEEILALFDVGETLQAIGDRYGVTRERVRQIVLRSGRDGRLSATMVRNDEIAATVVNEKLTLKEAADRFGIHAGTAAAILRTRHVSATRPARLIDAPEIVALAELVSQGSSVRSVSGGDHRVEHLVQRCCAEHGITTRHGRWRDMSVRRRIVIGMWSAGANWDEIAAAVSSTEGKETTPLSLYAWVLRHIPEMTSRIRAPRKERAARKAALPRAPRREPDPVIIASTPREAARLNYGRAPASAVAAAHGCTRNSIIGHWFRLRVAGVIGSAGSEASP